MKNLSIFIHDKFVQKDVDKLFENSICIDTIEEAADAAVRTLYGNYANIVFTNSTFKARFLDKLMTVKPDVRIINCNCTVDHFFENDFTGFLVFNNLKKCQHQEIIEEIKKHKKSVLLL